MQITSGTRIGGYEIIEPLGTGGMGSVYRASDRRLGRDVAIKTLPADLARDPASLARFEREARFLASLNHPNIATIYGIEEFDGERFLILELIPGVTLEGPMPVDQAVRVAIDIASGLGRVAEKHTGAFATRSGTLPEKRSPRTIARHRRCASRASGDASSEERKSLAADRSDRRNRSRHRGADGVAYDASIGHARDCG